MGLDAPGIPLADLKAWAAALAVFAAAYLPGSLLCIGYRFHSVPQAAALRLTLGLAILPALVLGVGQRQGWLFTFPWTWIALGGIAFAAIHAYGAIRPWARARKASTASPAADSDRDDSRPALKSAGVLEAAGWVAVAATALLVLGPLLCPPWHYDVLEYHLGVVAHYFDSGSITPIPHVFYSAQPLATEMLYTLGHVLEGTPRGVASGLIQWLLLVHSLWLLSLALAALNLPRVIRPWLVLLYVSHPVIFKLEVERLTDLTGALFVLAGLSLWLSELGRAGEKKRLAPAWVMMGFLVGGAIGSKWTNAGTTALILASTALAPILVRVIKREQRASENSTLLPRASARSVVVSSMLILLGAVAALLPWLVWLGVQTGNPFAPFLAGVFPSEAWGAERLAFLLETHGPLSPLSLAYWRNLFSRLMPLGMGPPLMVMAAAAGLGAAVLWRGAFVRGTGQNEPDERSGEEPTAGVLAALALGLVGAVAVALVLWGGLRQAEDRFLAPVFAAQFVLLGAALALLCRRLGPGLHALVALALAALAMFYWPGQLSAIKNDRFWDRALGRETAGEFLDRVLGRSTTEFFSEANGLPEGSRLIVVGDARRYYFHGPVALASVFDRHPIAEAIEEGGSTEEIAGRLRALGFTHLAVNEYEIARLLEFHPPPVLTADPRFSRLRERGRSAWGEIARDYMGYVEVGVEPLGETERADYGRFLGAYRQRASYFSSGAELYPALWIAPL